MKFGLPRRPIAIVSTIVVVFTVLFAAYEFGFWPGPVQVAPADVAPTGEIWFGTDILRPATFPEPGVYEISVIDAGGGVLASGARTLSGP
jgi:hypothetical protein